MVHFSPDRKFVLSNDLNDKVYSYELQIRQAQY
jgi:hypothetical protein